MDQACCLMPSEVRQIVMTLSIASITAAGCRTVCTFTLSQIECGSDPFIAALFFGSFTVVAQFVLLNVVIAVLMAQVHLQISSCKACAYHRVVICSSKKQTRPMQPEKKRRQLQRNTKVIVIAVMKVNKYL